MARSSSNSQPQAAPGIWRLLLVEDDDDFVERLIALLEADGRFQILARARNGAEAVTLARTIGPDVTLMDIEMPIMDGVEATRQILAHSPSARVIAISGSNYSERALEARLAGAYDYVRTDRLEDDLVDTIVTAAATQR